MKIFGIPIFPDQASTFAKDVDALYFFILAVCAFFALTVAVAVIYFGIRYHKTHDGEIGARIEGSLPLELLWSVIPTIIAMVMFGWGASVFYHLRRPPDDAMHIYAVGKQWMWKFQHLEGQREINELHIPAGRPIKITISSEDVLHSLYFPAFRTKMDAIPGRYTELWFEAQHARDVPHFLRRVLRHQPRRHDRQRHRARAVAVPGVAAGRRRGRHAGAARRQAVRKPGLQQLPPRQRPGPRSVAERHRRQDRGAAGRQHRGRRRRLPARVDPDLAGEDRERVPAADADLPGPDQRREPAGVDRTREIAVAASVDGSRSRRASRLHRTPRNRPRRRARRSNKPCWTSSRFPSGITCTTATA